MGKTGILLCGHGSRSTGAVSEFEGLAKALTERFPDNPVSYGFLEFATPIIQDGLASLLEQGVTKVLAVPGMLFAAGHVKNDVASVLNDYAATQEGIEIGFGRDLGIDPKMLAAARDRIEQAERDAPDEIAREDTLLMVIGRGTSDPDANGNIAKISRMLGEGMGYGWTETAYSGVTFPLVAPGLEHAVKLGYKRIIVFPYFLFTGILIQRIYDITDQIAAQNADIDFVKAGYLNAHPSVVDTFVDRVQGIEGGDNNMNCLTCIYREQVIGFEAAVGRPQQGHHYHVQGVGTGTEESHSHGHEHEHDHDHSHTHAPHPHADHPHGPGKRDPNAA
ncbi:MAG: sirohydrochlorin chelatase [Alphaproteobacteria bacterium]|nr:sirohydrochlorin chelatase [Alphaproteobacteria bacterium]